MRCASMRSRNGSRAAGDISIMASPLCLLGWTEAYALGALDHLDEGQDGIGVVLGIRERSGDEAGHREAMLMRERFRIRDERSGQSDAKSTTIYAEMGCLPGALA